MVVARRGCGCATIDAADALSSNVTANARNRILVQCYIDTALTIAAWALGLWLLDRLLTYAEGRGWIYYRKPRPASSNSAARGFLSTFQEIVQPEIRYVKEDRDQRLSVSGNEDPSER